MEGDGRPPLNGRFRFDSCRAHPELDAASAGFDSPGVHQRSKRKGLRMNIITIVDTETQGVDPKIDRAIEVAAVKYSIEHACVIESFACLIEADSNAAESINHIPTGVLKYGYSANGTWARLEEIAVGSDAILAHNAAFDRRFIPETVLNSIPWICTLNGITWPKTGDARNLVAIALAHGLGVVDPHRALADCMLLARLLTRCAELGTDVSAMLQRGLRPTAHYQAIVSYEQREAAKAKGFQWDASTRRWCRTMAIEDAVPEVLGFEVRRIAASIDV